MCQELNNLAAEFANYRNKNGKKKLKYPTELWDAAVDMCDRHSITTIVRAIGVNKDSLRLHKKARRLVDKKHCQNEHFIPINFELQESIQVQINAPFLLKIEFNRSTEELAKFILAIQGKSSC